jgi:hypothetical protein
MEHSTFFEGLDTHYWNQPGNTVAYPSLNPQKHDFSKDLQ